MTAETEQNPNAPVNEASGPGPNVTEEPTSPPDTPGIPDWVPPTDSGQPTATELNDVSQFRRQTIAAENTAIPITYGRDRFFGSIFVLHVDDTNGFLYVAYGFSEGEIEDFEIIYVDGVDVTDPEGFLSFAGAEVEEHVGTPTQTASALLSGVLGGFTDTYPDLAYLVFKVPTEASQGFPRVEAVIKGKLLYDPRLDTTVGGSGAHRIDEPATWEYSANPTLAFYDFVRANTDWTLTVADVFIAADFNDESVGGAARHAMGLTLFKPVTSQKWTKAFRVYCGCYFAWEDGELRLIPDRADVEVQGAAIFDQVNGTEITMGDQPELDFNASEDFTVEAWFNCDDSSNNGTVVAKKDALAGTSAGYSIYVSSSGNIIGTIADGSSNQSTTYTGNFNDDAWYHVALVIDRGADTMLLVVDGTDNPSGTTSISSIGSSVSSEAFRIAADETGNVLSGKVDEVRVWDDVRTNSEITNNRFDEIADPTSEGSLVGYWRLNDVTGSTAVDDSSSGNDGTLLGNAGFTTGSPVLIPEGILRHFTADDISNRGFQLRKKANRAFPTQVQVEYTDSSGTNWPVARQRASAEGVEEGTAPKRISKISLPGIHSAAQAKRVAIERLNWFLSDLECVLPVFDEGIEIQQGSVVAVTHPIGLTAKLFRVRKITGGSGRWIFDLSEYDPQIYSDEVISDPTFPDTQLGDPLNSPTVSGLNAVEELFNYKNGITGSRVRITWTASNYPFLSQYLVEGYVDGTLVFQTATQLNVAVTPGVEELVSDSPVTYEVRVYIQTPYAVGAPATDNVSILGKLAAPGDVPQITGTQIAADQVALSWGAATDIDIWRYEVKKGTTSDTWSSATTLDLIDGLAYIATGLAVGTHRFFVKARDTVANESANAVTADVTLSLPDAVTSVSGFEVASEVRLSWPAVTTGFVARYRIAYDTVSPSDEIDLDVVDTLRFQTKDVPEGTWKFLIYAQDGAGNEATTAATIDIEVTSDADAFLADSFDFVSPALTNMHSFVLTKNPLETRYVSNLDSGETFDASAAPHDFDTETVTLAGYHSALASQYLSETHDFGIQLTGSWNLTPNVTALEGVVTSVMELSTDDSNWDVYSEAAKGTYRYGRIRITTDNPPGTATAFVISPAVNLKVTVVPIEESGSDTATSSGPKKIALTRNYSFVKEVVVQPKNTIDAITGVVDNIIVGPNTAVLGDGTNYLNGGDVAIFDFGATQDFSVECWTKNTGATGSFRLVGKQLGGAAQGWGIILDGTNDRIQVRLGDGTNNIDLNSGSSTVPDDGDWHHVGIAVDRTGDTLSIYIDGTLQGGAQSISTLTGTLANGNSFRTHANASGAEIFSGGIDEVRIWNDIRSASEFNDNKDAEIDPTTAGLIGYWRMDGTVSGSVTTVQDEHANNNDLTDTGAGDCTYVSSGSGIVKTSSFDAYVFDIFGQQLAEEFQWKWKGV